MSSLFSTLTRATVELLCQVYTAQPDLDKTFVSLNVGVGGVSWIAMT